jgi:hypothetical protein
MTVALALTIAALTAYFCGRVHEWSRQKPGRRLAYCEGYDQASSSMLSMTSSARGNERLSW